MLKTIVITPFIDADGRQMVKVRRPYSLNKIGIYEVPDSVDGLSGKTKALCYAYITEARDYDLFMVLDQDVEENFDWVLTSMANTLAFEQDSRIGVVNGIRVMISRENIPTIAKAIWVYFSEFYRKVTGTCWGGSMVIRKELLPDFAFRWSESIFDDVYAEDICKRLGYKIVLDDDMVFADKTNVTLVGAFDFIKRQLIDVRMYGSLKANIGVWAMWFLLLVVTAATWSKPWLAVLVYASFGLCGHLRNIPAVFLAQWMHLLAVPLAYTVKRFSWYDYEYEISN